MTYKEILKLREGAHVGQRQHGDLHGRPPAGRFTLTTILPERKLLIQCYSERAHLLWQDTVEDVFSSGKGREV